MNTHLLKNIHTKVSSWVFAITVCLVIHLILFLAFSKAKQPTVENTSVADQSQIMMIPFDMETTDSTIKSIFEWLHDENPTLIVEPNHRAGYSAIIKEGFALPSPSKKIPNYKQYLLNSFLFLPSMKITPIQKNYLTLKDFFITLTTYFPAMSQATVIPEKETLHYPVVTDLYKDYSLPVKFFNLGENNSLVQKANPTSSTIIEFYYPKDKSLFPIGNIVESCGNDTLDKIALDTIITQNFPDFIKDRLAGRQVYLKVQWTAQFDNTKKEEKK